MSQSYSTSEDWVAQGLADISFTDPTEYGTAFYGAQGQGKPAKDKSRHSRSDKHGKGSSSTTTKASGSSSRRGFEDINFLFVVNEMNLRDDAQLTSDNFGNYLPPENVQDFGEERMGKVFRYSRGSISGVASHYYWGRVPGYRGGIMTQRHAEVPKYSCRTVYNCGPFLSFLYKAGDASDLDDEDAYVNAWEALHFTHEAAAVSRVQSGGRYRTVASQRPSWATSSHQILSSQYQNPNRNASQVGGLGGDIALIIGLMALSQSRNHIDDAFEARLWHHRRWTGIKHHDAWPGALDEPRGVFVHIALDPSSDTTMEDILAFEQYGIAVQG